MPADVPNLIGMRVRISFTEAEIDSYFAVVQHARSALLTRHRWDPSATIAASFVLALSCDFLADWLAPGRRTGGLVAAFVFISFWIGVWSRELGSAHYGRQSMQLERGAFATEWSGFLMAANSRAIRFQREDGIGMYRWAAFREATTHGGLLLLWLSSPLQSPLPVPLRLLTPEQAAGLMAMIGRSAQANPPSGASNTA